ncbi:MAG: hypothetical protein R3B06_30640 [Kofleriaceae bacterium]
MSHAKGPEARWSGKFRLPSNSGRFELAGEVEPFEADVVRVRFTGVTRRIQLQLPDLLEHASFEICHLEVAASRVAEMRAALHTWLHTQDAFSWEANDGWHAVTIEVSPDGPNVTHRFKPTFRLDLTSNGLAMTFGFEVDPSCLQCLSDDLDAIFGDAN